MINFDKIESPVNIDAEFILSKISEEMIFSYYFGNFELGKVYSSKFRKDNKPSTGFYISKSGKIIYNDLTTSEKLNCFAFVAKLYNIRYGEACKKIAYDFGLVKDANIKPLAKNIIEQTISFDREYKKNTLIQIIPSRWESQHINYWKQYYLSVEDVVKQKVYPVKRLFINKRELAVSDLTFAYLVKDRDTGTVYMKIYQPYSKDMKWISNIPLTIPFGLNTLKYSTDHLIVSKAQKDRMILLKFFDSVIGTQNESEAALTDDLVKHFNFHFPRKTIIWDNDETGVFNCKKFNSKGFGYFNIPKILLEKGIKDVSDFVKEFGMNELERLLIEKDIL